ncbi:MAG: NTP transferase domain-containing protein [Bacteroides sp.]|nr:NTP transferase domain-containing protein [Bacteroides sp.]MCM1379295.1 NTP transferase domain-containing protein [Bacteroides sp.]MCM1445046.1 NTP transferase domain-containing protein [Prevotella sp.]
MHYAILAAGEGSRLDMVAAKPLAPIQGQTLISRLLNIIARRPDTQQVVAVINSRKPEIESHLRGLNLPCELKVISTQTPSAAHTLQLALDHLPDDEQVIALTVDTVFLASEFNSYVDSFKSTVSADVLMGATRYADDEKPLYIEVGKESRIRAFRDFPLAGADHVSAGIYGISHRAKQALQRAISLGINGLREAQRSLLLQNLDVKAYEFSQVFDVDRPHDLLKAREFLINHED